MTLYQVGSGFLPIYEVLRINGKKYVVIKQQWAEHRKANGKCGMLENLQIYLCEVWKMLL